MEQELQNLRLVIIRFVGLSASPIFFPFPSKRNPFSFLFKNHLMPSQSQFEFRWFDYATATAAQTEQILHIYEYVFKHDIELTFDGSLDADFSDPLKYYAPEVRGAYGVVVHRKSVAGEDGIEAAEEEEIVGTVGIRRIAIPDSCYSGAGSDRLPAIRAATAEDSNVCELKRMFLLPAARGKGLSKVMLDEVLRKARDFGYEAMVLDTRIRLQAANRLYETVGGFVEFTDYNGNPRPDRFMIRRL
jgi:GNAT superfamily N-acetyltransferase